MASTRCGLVLGEEAGQPALPAHHKEEVLRGRPHFYLEQSGSALGASNTAAGALHLPC